MNIWPRLGISVALVAGFCIATAELLLPTRFYERHKWSVCASLLISGLIIFVVGRWLNRRQRNVPDQDGDADGRPDSLLVRNLPYLGIMTVVFGCITVFLVPTYTKKEKAKVAAQARQPAAPKPKPSPAPADTNPPVPMPRFDLQGITLRELNPSALINGRTYFVGDHVQNSQVIAIDNHSVVLEWRGTNIVLRPPN